MGRTRASVGEPLGRDEIVDAAMRVTKRSGLDRLTMRALAAELDVTPMAVYHHVQNKAELLQLVADAAVAGVAVPPPETGPWEARLAALVRELRARLAEFPGVGPYLLGSDVPTPGADRVVESGIAMLVDAGFGEEEATLAFTAVHNYLLGRLYVEASLRGPRLRRLRRRRSAMREPSIPRLSADRYFEYGLEHLIRGLATRSSGDCGQGVAGFPE
ncbi:MAG TPA: TetR/AcrR family transcriptional regulator [Acidimicrobiia bacterium]|nr:TetR/AcrR family transcriptional regulator [Acidimicrobiia bacterium]